MLTKYMIISNILCFTGGVLVGLLWCKLKSLKEEFDEIDEVVRGLKVKGK